MNAGLTLVRDPPVSAIATAALDDKSPTAIYNELVQSGPFRHAIEQAIRRSATGKSAIEFRDYLEAFDLPRGLDELAVRMAKGERRAAYLFANAVQTLGEGRSPIEDTYSVLSLLEGVEHPPTIRLDLDAGFFERRGDQRESICELIALLARACDVRIVGGKIDHWKLAQKHREDLPGVSEQCNTRPTGVSPEAAAEAAWDALGHDSREVQILRTLQHEPSETLSRHALQSTAHVSRSRISQCVSELTELGVVGTFDTADGGYLELLEAGRIYLDTFDQELGRQAELDTSIFETETGTCQCESGQIDKPTIHRTPGGVDEQGQTAPTSGENGTNTAESVDSECVSVESENGVSETGKSSIYCREHVPSHETPPEEVGPAATGPADRRRTGTTVNTAYMPRWREAAVAGSATEGAITLVDHPVPPSDELRQPYLSYFDDDRLVVGAEYTNPMQYGVCIARALTNHRVFANVLTPERVDGDSGSLGGLVTDDTVLLRNARCLGWLKDRDATADAYAEALQTAEDELVEMTYRWHTGDYTCPASAYRSQITQVAHGIIGTVAHLCDLADVELVREVRLPEFTRRFDDDDRQALAKTLVHGAKIASSHGHFAAYRQLFEPRDDKRATALTPSIPADDPSGEMIGSYVVVGANVSGFAPDLESEIRGTTNDETGDDIRLHEDAPEFDVPISITTDGGRPAIASVARECLTAKNLVATRESIALFDALAGSPYDVAKAIMYGLQAEDRPREIRLDEVRRVVAQLPAERLLPDMQPTIQKITKALLTVASPLTQSELADRADVSARSVRTHLPKLEALGLADVSDAGIRFALPFTTSEERGADIVPGLATGRGPTTKDVAYELAQAIVGEDAHDPETPVGGAFFRDDWDEALRRVPGFDVWVELIARLCQHGMDAETTTIRFGTESEQAAITEVAA